MATPKNKNNNRIFSIVAEKLPIESLGKVNYFSKSHGLPRTGIYVAHDSVGYARYVGLGRIFSRLKKHHKKYHEELKYFSFYIVPNPEHQRELETLLIRVASPLLEFNKQKKTRTISVGDIKDYGGPTMFFERLGKKSAKNGSNKRKTRRRKRR